MIHVGDCVAVMAAMPEASVDAIVTDPPYGLEFMGRDWDRLDGARIRKPTEKDTSRGAGGHAWSASTMFAARNVPDAYVAGSRMQEWHQRWATEALRVAKPGAYLLAFGGTRTSHRLACAIEDAGWIIRDTLVWAYAQGFPKSRALLKPAWEPIVMARKPGPLRELAIDACRIPTGTELRHEKAGWQTDYVGGEQQYVNTFELHPEPLVGRWPANVILTDDLFSGGVEGVVGGGTTTSGLMRAGTLEGHESYGGFPGREMAQDTYGDSGTYSRFFLLPKADRTEREPLGHNGARVNVHPTVKSLDLMRHLVRLVTPVGGTVLDPFLGSGTTAIAAEMEGFAWIGIEREAEYVAIAEARLQGVQRGLGLDVA